MEVCWHNIFFARLGKKLPVLSLFLCSENATFISYHADDRSCDRFRSVKSQDLQPNSDSDTTYLFLVYKFYIPTDFNYLNKPQLTSLSIDLFLLGSFFEMLPSASTIS